MKEGLNMKIEKIKKHFISIMIMMVILMSPIIIYLEYFYSPEYSPYDNELFGRTVEKCDYVIQYIEDNIDNPTIQNLKTVKKEARQILVDEFSLRNKQTIINKIIKNEYTLTQNQTEVLKEKYDNVFCLEEKFTISVLEKVFHVKNFSVILESAKTNNEYQSKGINVKYIDQKYHILLEGSSILFLDRTTQPEEESLESVISRRFFLIDTVDQKYYLRVPSEFEMTTGEDSIVLRSDSLKFNLTGKVFINTGD